MISDLVFLLDIDNTLLDNDRFGADLGARLEQAFGAAERDRYAVESADNVIDPLPDISIGAIAELLDVERSHYLAASARNAGRHAEQAISKEQA